MVWAKASMVLGVVLLVLGFHVGSEPSAVRAGAHAYTCDSVIPTSWFASGGGPGDTATSSRTPAERRLEERCDGLVTRDRWLTWGAFGIGGLLALVGWTVVREEGWRPARRALPASPRSSQGV